MFPVFRPQTTTLPFASPTDQPLVYRPEEVNQFVDRFEAPAALRDPFTGALLCRPVAFRDAQHGLYDTCVSENTLRNLARSAAPLAPGAQQGAQGMGSTELLRHRPMAHQLGHFYADARAATARRLAANDPQRLALERFLDASEVLLSQPLVPMLATEDLRGLVATAVVPLERAQCLSAALDRLLRRLLSELERPEANLMRIERRRRRLTHDMVAMRQELARARCLLAPLLMPLTPLGHRLAPDWSNILGQLRQQAHFFEVALLYDVPCLLADRARIERDATLFALHAYTNAASRPPSRRQEG